MGEGVGGRGTFDKVREGRRETEKGVVFRSQVSRGRQRTRKVETPQPVSRVTLFGATKVSPQQRKRT